MDESDEVVREVARDYVTELAPEELPLFRPISDAYLRDPGRPLDPRGDGDEVLGFGMDAAVVLMTPIVLAVVHDVVLRVRAQLVDQLAEQGGDVVERWLHRLFRGAGPAAGAKIPALSPAQLAEVRQLAYDGALKGGISEKRASSLADWLTARLAMQAAT